MMQQTDLAIEKMTSEPWNIENFTTDSPSDGNDTSSNCPTTNPSFVEYMTDMSVGYLLINSALAVLTLLVIVIFIGELLFLYKKSSRRLQRHKAKWLLGIYPMISVTAFISLLAPRTSGMNDLVSLMYVTLCVYIFVVMVIEEYGGPKRMMARLNGAPLNVLMLRPWCICFKCLPSISVTNTTLQVLHAMIMQFVLVRPFIGYIIALMRVDESYGITNTVTMLGYISSLSSLMAIWSFAMICQLCSTPLAHLQIAGKFTCLQSVLLITGIQRSIISVFVQVGLITCQDSLTSAAVADRWNHMVMIVEMLIISLFARRLYRSSMLKRIKLMEEAMASQSAVTLESRDSYIDIDN